MRISAGKFQEISSRLLQLKSPIPSIFAHTPRGLDELERWKATEFRQFLLYTGRLVLKGVLREDLYNHFLTFSVAIGLLVCPTLVQPHHHYAQNLLQYFVEKGCELYGATFLVYNTHTMLHLSTDAIRFKSLDNCSAFVFENHLQTIKKMVRSGKNSLAQVANRLEENLNRPIAQQKNKSSKKRKDQAYQLDDGESCEVVAMVEKEGKVLCRVYGHPEPLFSEPCSSFLVGVYKYEKRNMVMEWIPTTKIWRAIQVERKSSTIFMAVLHQV
ncbi:hypothetical protein DPEC_G00361100 [Dallia pectoralis]|uniref:Uncharacterized protein n=1 Tax=Dallia pectoralis TaxID=75939 RepID=A0ACC2F116_DALPE|nr:hypothetical protein DPEC_G00361100 [Dallia pectoralis]